MQLVFGICNACVCVCVSYLSGKKMSKSTNSITHENLKLNKTKYIEFFVHFQCFLSFALATIITLNSRHYKVMAH